MITALILAGVGLVINLLGRWLIVREDESLSGAKRWLLILVPGAELLFMLLCWERARTGSVVCALSFALVLPVLGKASMLWNAARQADATTLWSGQFQAILQAESDRIHGKAADEERTKVVAAKRAKLAELEAYLQEWYRLLEERRGYLCDELPEDTRLFNADAEAYHGLLTASKVELAELKQLDPTVN